MTYYLENKVGQRKKISELVYLYAVNIHNFYHVLRDESVTIIKGELR